MSWYDTEDWYSPNEKQPTREVPPEPKEDPGKEPKKDPTGRLVWTGLIAALLIVAIVLGVTIPKLGKSQKATALPTPAPTQDQGQSAPWEWNWNWGKQDEEPREDPGFRRDAEEGSPKQDGNTDSGLPEDWESVLHD